MGNFADIAKAGKDFACGLYKAQPGALIPNPISKLLTSVYDELCDYTDNPGLPPPAAALFQGGQCENINYLITYSGTNEVGAAFTGQTGVVKGKISSQSIYTRDFPSVGVTNFNFVLFYKDGAGTPQRVVWVSLNYQTTSTIIPRAQITNIQRLDGGADNCGNPPPAFRPEPPPPPGGYNSPPKNIIFNDNVTNIDITYNFVPPLPPRIAPNNFLPPIVINYGEANANFKIPITFNFNGSVNFGDAPSGSGGGGTNFNQDDRDNINNIKNTTNNTNNTTSTTNNNVTNFYNDFKLERDKTDNKPPTPTDFDPPKPPALPGKHTQVRLAFVEVNLTKIPSNAKTQSGDGAPNVIYAGWFEFTRANKLVPREPIHFQNNCFIAPVGVDGYAFTLYDGFEGTAVAITNKE